MPTGAEIAASLGLETDAMERARKASIAGARETAALTDQGSFTPLWLLPRGTTPVRPRCSRLAATRRNPSAPPLHFVPRKEVPI